jgi:hypothetical protein
MEEKRKVRRTRVLKGAKIIFNQRVSSVDCIVRNLSDAGACLQLASQVGFPATFELSLDGDRSLRSCRVTWRGADRIGVVFDGPTQTSEGGEAGSSLVFPPANEGAT